jgi:hypothetical protein
MGVVFYNGGSAALETLKGEDGARFNPRYKDGGEDLLDLSDIGGNIRLLDPAGD